MELKQFDSLLKENNAIRISEEYIIFNDYELYSFNTKVSKKYKDIETLISKNDFVREIIENTSEFTQEYDGGRGSSSSNGKMGGGFNHAPKGRGKKEYGEVKYPAEFNTEIKSILYDASLEYLDTKKRDGVIVPRVTNNSSLIKNPSLNENKYITE